MTEITTLHYASYQIEAINQGGELWLRGGQICQPLGLSDLRVLSRIVEKNIEEFGADETRLIPIETAGGRQEVRVFSLRGARLLALLARTPEAKAFRRWVLDFLEGRVRPRSAAPAWGKPGTLSADAKRALEAAMGLIEADHPARAALRGIVDTGAGLPDDPTLAAHADAWDVNIRAQRAVSGEFSRIRHLAARDGYSEEAVKAEIRRRRRDGGQTRLALGEGAP